MIVINRNLNINMKKMNRSQSSYRNCKTLITEQDTENVPSKYGSRAPLLKANLASSMLQPNKQNSYLFQSVSERQFHTKSREDLCESENPLEELKRRCRDYEQQIRRLYEQQQKQAIQKSSPYNYSQQFYVKQNQELKKRLERQNTELEQLKELMTLRTDESDTLSEVNSRLQRDQKDKNLFVKELNNKNITIFSLQEKNKFQKGEIDTLRMYLQQKTQRLAELQAKVGQVDMRKKKLEQYESKIKESHDFLKELETQTHKLKEETEAKDAVILEKSKSIAELEQTINSYEDKLRAIEQSLLRYSEERKSLQENSQKLARESSQWKESYEQLLHKSETVQQMQIQLKTYAAMVQDLNRKNMELTSANENFKISCSTLEKNTARLNQTQKENQSLRKEVKERDERIIQFQAKEKAFRHLEQCYGKLRKEKDETVNKFQEKIKQNKHLNIQLEEAAGEINALKEEIVEIRQENTRTKEKGEKIDMLMKENNRLNSTLMDKVNDIQKLQFRINHLDSKFNNAVNQTAKQKTLTEQKEQQIREMQVEIEDIRGRYEAETHSRIQLEDKIVRSNQEILALRFNINKLQQENEQSRIEIEDSSQKHEKEVREVRGELASLQQNKKEMEEILQQSKKRIEILRNEVEQCKSSLEEAQRKERQHFAAVGLLQQDLLNLRQANQKLAERNRSMSSAAQKIKELSQFIVSKQIL